MIPGETGPVSFFSNYRRYGPDAGRTADIVEDSDADVVFLSLFAFAYAEEAAALARELRRRRPGRRLILGGAGASVWPEYFDGSLPDTPCACDGDLFDEVVVGEAEAYLGLEGHEPSWSEPTPMARGAVSVSLSLTRGCRRSCSFCSTRLAHGTGFRSPRSGSAAAAVDAILDAAQGRELWLNVEDDNILYAPDLLDEVLDRVERHEGTVRLSFENGLDYRLLDEAGLRRLAAAGLAQLNLSLGDASAAAPSRLAAVLEEARRLGVPAVTYFIAGMPGAPTKNVTGTFALLSELASLPTDVGISVYYPVRGLASAPADAELSRLPPSLTAGSSLYPWGDMSTGELAAAFRAARYLNARRRTSAPSVAGSAGDELAARLVGRSQSSGLLHTARRVGQDVELVPAVGDEGLRELMRPLILDSARQESA